MDFKEWMELDEANQMMKGFKGWYDYNRGTWGEVEAAAQKDPTVRMILGRIEANLDSLEKAGPWGDELERAVERSFPNHSKRKARDQWEKERFNGAQPRIPLGPTRTGKGGPSAAANNAFQIRQDPSQQDTELSKVVSDHERRLKNLETFLKGTHKQPVGSMDATATYRR
jgi:hypothetical protein